MQQPNHPKLLSMRDTFTYQKPLPTRSWPSMSLTQSYFYDDRELKPLEFDKSKCEECGGKGIVWSKGKLNRSKAKECKCKKEL